MAEKRHESGFTVTDRRLFTEDGRELRQRCSRGSGGAQASDAPAACATPSAANRGQAVPPPAAARDGVSGGRRGWEQGMPPPPTAAEQTGAGGGLPAVVEGSRFAGRTQRTFGQRFRDDVRALPGVALHDGDDATGIDAAAGRAAAGRHHWRAADHRHAEPDRGKNQGQPDPTEENFLQNSLYELRMAYVEVTNALARPPQPGAATGTSGRSR